MISLARPLSAGNAIRLYLSLPAGAKYMRILRRTADVFTGPTDAGAAVVIDSFAGASYIDHAGLDNGTVYFYRAYNRVGTTWVDTGPSSFATPATAYIDDTLDPQELVRDRIQLGINAAVVRGELIPETGSVAVTTAPFALADGISFPTVSVHLESTGPAERGIGDEVEDFYDPALAEYIGSEGWLSRFSLTIAGVSLNADERISMRKTLRRIVQSNLPLFADAGMVLIEFQQTDSEQFAENNAPLYLTNGAFSCIAPAFIRDQTGSISDVTVTTAPTP